MLIRNADVWRQGRADVRLSGNKIAEIGELSSGVNEPVIDALGGALLPGLHDHHLHLSAMAVAGASVRCGPPEVVDAGGLAEALAQSGTGWLRGIGYHETVAGLLDVSTLDRMAPARPVRIQHRSGRMWFFNSLAMEMLLEDSEPPPGLNLATGQLFDEDAWLKSVLRGTPPGFAAISAQLAACGITGITDMSPANDAVMAGHFRRERAAGQLLQYTVLAGRLELAHAQFGDGVTLGPAKLHLHEADFPDLDDTIAFMRNAHAQDRAIAVHCTTEAELVFALSALESASVQRGDRIEHAGVAPDHLVEDIAQLNLAVVSQPHFIAERGDQYLRDVDRRDHDALYRLAAFQRAGVRLAAGSDGPYGAGDPWTSMAAAVSRRTASGQIVGKAEHLSPEAALALYLADPMDLGRLRAVEPGVPADLCLLDRPWMEARTRLSAADVRTVWAAGSMIHNRVD